MMKMTASELVFLKDAGFEGMISNVGQVKMEYSSIGQQY